MKSFIHNSGTFIGKEGNETYFQNWTVPTPDFNLLISHGIGYHSENFKTLVNELEDKNISIYSYDHRGFGKSGGKKGHVEQFMNFVQDLDIYYEMINQFDKETPFIIYGHSLGALIALNHMIIHPGKLKGAIISSPFINYHSEDSFWTSTFTKLTEKYLPETTIKNNNINIDPLNFDKKDIGNKNHYSITAGLNLETRTASSYVLKNIDAIATPVLILDKKKNQVDWNKLNNNFHTMDLPKNKSQSKKKEFLNSVLNWSFSLLSSKMKKRKIS